MEVDSIVADKAYSSKENLKMAKGARFVLNLLQNYKKIGENLQ